MKPIILSSKEISWIEKKIPNLKIEKEVIYKTVHNGDISICKRTNNMIELGILRDRVKIFFEVPYYLNTLINIDLPDLIDKIIDFNCTISITVWKPRFKVIYNLLKDKTKHSYIVNYIERDGSIGRSSSALKLFEVEPPFPNLPRTKSYSFYSSNSTTYYRDIPRYLTKDILITEFIFWKSMWLELKKKGY